MFAFLSNTPGPSVPRAQYTMCTSLNPFVPKASIFRFPGAIFELHLHLPGFVTKVEIVPYDSYLLVKGSFIPYTHARKDAQGRPSALVWTDGPSGDFSRDAPIFLSPGTEFVVLECRQEQDYIVRYTIRNSRITSHPYINNYGGGNVPVHNSYGENMVNNPSVVKEEPVGMSTLIRPVTGNLHYGSSDTTRDNDLGPSLDNVRKSGNEPWNISSGSGLGGVQVDPSHFVNVPFASADQKILTGSGPVGAGDGFVNNPNTTGMGRGDFQVDPPHFINVPLTSQHTRTGNTLVGNPGRGDIPIDAPHFVDVPFVSTDQNTPNGRVGPGHSLVNNTGISENTTSPNNTFVGHADTAQRLSITADAPQPSTQQTVLSGIANFPVSTGVTTGEVIFNSNNVPDTVDHRLSSSTAASGQSVPVSVIWRTAGAAPRGFSHEVAPAGPYAHSTFTQNVDVPQPPAIASSSTPQGVSVANETRIEGNRTALPANTPPDPGQRAVRFEDSQLTLASHEVNATPSATRHGVYVSEVNREAVREPNAGAAAENVPSSSYGVSADTQMSGSAKTVEGGNAPYDANAADVEVVYHSAGIPSSGDVRAAVPFNTDSIPATQPSALESGDHSAPTPLPGSQSSPPAHRADGSQNLDARPNSSGAGMSARASNEHIAQTSEAGEAGVASRDFSVDAHTPVGPGHQEGNAASSSNNVSDGKEMTMHNRAVEDGIHYDNAISPSGEASKDLARVPASRDVPAAVSADLHTNAEPTARIPTAESSAAVVESPLPGAITSTPERSDGPESLEAPPASAEPQASILAGTSNEHVVQTPEVGEAGAPSRTYAQVTAEGVSDAVVATGGSMHTVEEQYRERSESANTPTAIANVAAVGGPDVQTSGQETAETYRVSSPSGSSRTPAEYREEPNQHLPGSASPGIDMATSSEPTTHPPILEESGRDPASVIDRESEQKAASALTGRDMATSNEPTTQMSSVEASSGAPATAITEESQQNTKKSPGNDHHGTEVASPFDNAATTAEQVAHMPAQTDALDGASTPTADDVIIPIEQHRRPPTESVIEYYQEHPQRRDVSADVIPVEEQVSRVSMEEYPGEVASPPPDVNLPRPNEIAREAVQELMQEVPNDASRTTPAASNHGDDFVRDMDTASPSAELATPIQHSAEASEASEFREDVSQGRDATSNLTASDSGDNALGNGSDFAEPFAPVSVLVDNSFANGSDSSAELVLPVSQSFDSSPTFSDQQQISERERDASRGGLSPPALGAREGMYSPWHFVSRSTSATAVLTTDPVTSTNQNVSTQIGEPSGDSSANSLHSLPPDPAHGGESGRQSLATLSTSVDHLIHPLSTEYQPNTHVAEAQPEEDMSLANNPGTSDFPGENTDHPFLASTPTSYDHVSTDSAAQSTGRRPNLPPDS